MAYSANNNALVIKTIKGKRWLMESDVPVPQPRTNQALIRISHSAQNSLDVSLLDSGEFSDGSVLGCDFVGTVEKVGSNVCLVKEGDVIGGMIYGGETKGVGGYSEYTLADERLCFKLPPNIRREEAVTAPLAACMAYLGLFSKSYLNMNITGPDASVLIWGASSCVGRFAVQIAAIYRFRIIATCGPRNFELLRSLGAHHVLDYRDKNVVSRIQEIAPNLQYAFDAVGSPTYAASISRALTDANRKLCTVFLDDQYKSNAGPNTKISQIIVWKTFLHDHCFDGISNQPSVSDHELAAELFRTLPHWLKDGLIKPNHPRVLPGGLQAIQRGFEMDRSDGPLDYKLIYEI